MTKKSSSLEPTPPPVSRETPLYFIYFGVSIWAALVGYGAHFYFSFSQNDSGPRTTLSGPPRKTVTSDLQHAISDLCQAFPDADRVLMDAEVLKTYGSPKYTTYLGSEDVHPHGVVVFPLSTEDVVVVMNIAKKWGVPIVPFGNGSSLEGHTAGKGRQAICVDMSRMDRIIEIHEQDSDLVCQAGATWDDINATLEDKGIPLFFPLDPGQGATIGGMVSTGCSGTNAVRYGTAKGEWFLNLTVVLPSGEVIKTRSRAHKSSAGFDLTKLFIGAEGTLGIVTEATIKLAPCLPTTVAIAQFPDAVSACKAVTGILNSSAGSHIQCVELVDTQMMRAINLYASTHKSKSPGPYAEADSLFLKLQGTPQSISETSQIIRDIAGTHGCDSKKGFRLARGEDEAQEMWGHRRGALYASMKMVEGGRVWTTDVCVPVSNLPRLVYETKEDATSEGINVTIVGHVGDGNFHAALIFRNEEEYSKVQELSKRVIKRALSMDGTCTGEHGIGLGKRGYLRAELGEGTVELMKTLKRTIDPLGIMNPGKLYPTDDQP